MPNYRRSREGDTYFFTVVTHGCRPILCPEAVRTWLRETAREVRASLPFLIEAWVLLLATCAAFCAFQTGIEK